MRDDASVVRRPLAWVREATHLLAPLTANCRTFHARWAAEAGAAPGGKWIGTWHSETSGHGGPLRCVIEQVDANLWRATFHAGYARVFRACYASELHVTETAGRWTFRGRNDLGRLAGGVYHYDGEATRETFRATYTSRHDRGVFVLGRSAAPHQQRQDI